MGPIEATLSHLVTCIDENVRKGLSLFGPWHDFTQVPLKRVIVLYIWHQSGPFRTNLNEKQLTLRHENTVLFDDFTSSLLCNLVWKEKAVDQLNLFFYICQSYLNFLEKEALFSIDKWFHDRKHPLWPALKTARPGQLWIYSGMD